MGCETPPLGSMLVVDDDAPKSRVLRRRLAARGYVIAKVRRAEEAFEKILQKPAGLVLLDTETAGIGRIETCRRLRSIAPQAGLVLVTSRDSEEEKIEALEAGADDYLARPFSFRIFLARLHALSRRMGGDAGVLKAGDLELDLGRRILRRSNVPIDLSPTEFTLLSYLMQHADIPIERGELLRAIRGAEYVNEREYLRTFVRRLRKKIENDASNPQYLLTVPWLGYGLCRPQRPVASNFATGSETPPRISAPPERPLASTAVNLVHLGLRRLRAAIRNGEVSFPSQVPIFNRQSRADIQWRLAGLYFLRNWSCTALGRRYAVTMERVRQMLSHWVRRAIALGYLQEIPAASPWDPPETAKSPPRTGPVNASLLSKR
jgi:two-component system, OmpR family, KDP operon response regulator KdpE